MTKKEIREEVVALGSENFATEEGGEARINRWIQQAIREICDYKPWPFLLAEKEEEGPSITIADLGHVIAVSDLTHRNPIEPVTLNQLLLGDPNLESERNPEYWYCEDGTTIETYPISSSLFRVRYRKTPVELEDEEEPIIPVDYHDMIVTRVRAESYKGTDNFYARTEILKDYERERGNMVHALLKPNYDKDNRLSRTGRAWDYL